MGNETVTAPTRDLLPQADICSVVEARTTISEAIRQLVQNIKVALVTVQLHYAKEEKNSPAGTTSRNRICQSIDYLLQNIRPLVRKTDLVFLHQQNIYFVLLAANLQGAEIVEERLWEALLWRVHNMSEQEILRPVEMTIGHSAYPDPHADLPTLFAVADQVSKQAGTSARRLLRANGHPTRSEEPIQQDEREALPQLARKLGIPYLSPLPGKPPQSVLHIVNARLARELRCYPVGRERNILTVAMLNPQDRSTLERLRRETGLRIVPVLTHPEALERALEQLNYV